MHHRAAPTFLLAVLPLLGAGVVAPPLHAQAVSDSVPREFAELFIGVSGPEAALHVGRIPPALVGAVPLPSGLRVVGGVAGGWTRVIFAAQGTPEETLTAYHALLEEAGWSRAPDMSRLRGGFVDSRAAEVDVWCGAERAVTAGITARGEARYLTVQVMRRDRSPCETADRSQGMMGRLGIPALPALVAPAGVRQAGGGSGSGSDHVESFARLETGREPIELARHYAPQMEAAGWRVTEEPSASAAGTALARFSLTHGGEPWTALLLVYRVGEGSLRAVLRADREEPW